MDERFSAVLDEEASIEEIEAVIDTVLNDEDARECWTRQYMLKAVLQEEISSQPVTFDAGFADRVMAELYAEDSAQASGRPTQPAPVGLHSIRSRWRQRRRGGRSTGLRTGFGAAAAASIVGVVVFAYAPFGEQNHTPSHSHRTASRSTVNHASVNAPTGLRRTVADNHHNGQPSNRIRHRVPSQQSNNGRWSVSDPALRRELNGYLIQHNGLARNFGLSASTPTFVHAATYRTRTSP